MTTVCPPEHEALLDCGDDDYFSTSPPAGSYLAGRWNTASSSFLQFDQAPAPARLSLAGADTLTYGARASLAGRLTDRQTGAAIAGRWRTATATTLTSRSSYTPRARPSAR